MEYRKKVAHKLIQDADNDWNFIINSLKSTDFFNILEIVDDDEKYRMINKLGSELALVSEKYMKALYLKNAIIPQEIIDSLNNCIRSDKNRIGNIDLSENDVVNLIVSNDDIRTNYLFSKLNKQQKNILKAINFRGISHEFNKVFDNQKIDINVSQNIKYSLLNKICYLKYSDIIFTSTDDINDELNSSSVKDAFEKGRYSSISEYMPNLDFLLFFVMSVQREITSVYDGLKISEMQSYDINDSFIKSKQYCAAGLVSFSRCIHIFPDIHSDVVLYNENKTDIYSFDKHIEVYAYSTDKKLKSEKDLYNEYKNAKEVIGLVSKDNELAKFFIECNKGYNKNGFILDSDELITYYYDGKKKFLTNIKGQIYCVNSDYGKKIEEKYNRFNGVSK